MYKNIRLGLGQRIYSPKALKDFAEHNKDKQIFGEICHPTVNGYNRQIRALFSESSHTMENFKYNEEDNCIYADIKILETHYGKVLKEVIQSTGIEKVKFSMRAIGKSFDDDNLKIITWDFSNNNVPEEKNDKLIHEEKRNEIMKEKINIVSPRFPACMSIDQRDKYIDTVCSIIDDEKERETKKQKLLEDWETDRITLDGAGLWESVYNNDSEKE